MLNCARLLRGEGENTGKKGTFLSLDQTHVTGSEMRIYVVRKLWKFSDSFQACEASLGASRVIRSHVPHGNDILVIATEAQAVLAQSDRVFSRAHAIVSLQFSLRIPFRCEYPVQEFGRQRAAECVHRVRADSDVRLSYQGHTLVCNKIYASLPGVSVLEIDSTFRCKLKPGHFCTFDLFPPDYDHCEGG